jgi:hypothetical protein
VQAVVGWIIVILGFLLLFKVVVEFNSETNNSPWNGGGGYVGRPGIHRRGI